MPRYSIYGLSVESELDLGNLSPSHSESPDVFIRFGEVFHPGAKTAPDEEFVAIRGVGNFRIWAGREITLRLEPGIPDGLAAVLLSGRMMAYLIRQRGWLPLHASAVKVGDSAVLFSGPVGSGKSTTAAAFHSFGYPVLCDDVAPVALVEGVCTLRLGPSQVRLCEDAAEVFRELDPGLRMVFDKRRLSLPRTVAELQLPVAGIYLLADSPELYTAQIPAMEALAALGKECFIRLQHAGPEVTKAHLRDCASVASVVPVRRLFRPRDLTRVGALVEAVVASLQD